MADDAARRAALDAEVTRHKNSFADIQHVTAERLMQMLAETAPVTVVDVRSAEERAVSTLPGAVALSELPPRSEGPLVLYCYPPDGTNPGQVKWC
jgi:hypothetical protein